MEVNTLTPKPRKNRKLVKIRKPSKPLDGINHRLLREQAALNNVVESDTKTEQIDEISPPNRQELETKAKEINIKFTKRTSDKKLEALISEKLGA
jgi:hypothetical protein